MADGDPIGFYAVELRPNEAYRLEDDGTVVPLLEAIGVNLKSGTRRNAFVDLLSEYGFHFDEKSQTICSEALAVSDIPSASLRFMAVLIRLQDFQLLAPKVVEGTFREDALAAIRERFGNRVKLIESSSFADEGTADYLVDVVFSLNGKDLAAIYIGTSPAKADEAVILRMEMRERRQLGRKVLLLLETTRPPGWSERILARAQNKLDGVAVFRGHKADAMDKIEETVFGNGKYAH
jgi:hypothetical protein